MKKDKYSKLQTKSVHPAQFIKLNKKIFIKKFLKNHSGIIWPREMKIVKTLFKIFPDESFWDGLELSFKLNSLCWFLSDDGRKFLNQEYKKFNLNLPEVKKFEFENNNLAFNNKSSYDLNKALNLREFLNLWQKKTL